MEGLAGNRGRPQDKDEKEEEEEAATVGVKLWECAWAEPNNALPGSPYKRLTGNGEKLTYSPAAGCNWLCLASQCLVSLPFL